MENKLTLQTEAAFDRIYDALLGKTEDNLSSLSLQLNELQKKVEQIQDVSACILTGDC